MWFYESTPCFSNLTTLAERAIQTLSQFNAPSKFLVGVRFGICIDFTKQPLFASQESSLSRFSPVNGSLLKDCLLQNSESDYIKSLFVATGTSLDYLDSNIYNMHDVIKYHWPILSIAIFYTERHKTSTVILKKYS